MTMTPRTRDRREVERRAPKRGVTIRHDDPHVPKRVRKGQKRNDRDETFLRGASWAYQELTGALIVPASFEEQARAEISGAEAKPRKPTPDSFQGGRAATWSTAKKVRTIP